MTDLQRDNAELIACPFCGAEDSFSERADLSSSYVVCNNCLARGPVECQSSDEEEEPGQANAIAAWNTRSLSPQPPAETGDDGEVIARLWLWRNFVDGKPEYWAFDNPFPTFDGGDPQTLGQPCGWALYKRSTNGRPDVPDSQVEAIASRLSISTGDDELVARLRADDPSDYRKRHEEMLNWTSSAFLAGEPVADELALKGELYHFLCCELGYLLAAEVSARNGHEAANRLEALSRKGRGE